MKRILKMSMLGVVVTLAGLNAGCRSLVSHLTDKGPGEPIAPRPYECGSYNQCRSQFLAMVESQSVNHVTERHEAQLRPGSFPELMVDAVRFKSSVNRDGRLLILSSGIHGLEGYTGSSLQQLFLNELLAETLAAGIDVLMIHGINAWGMVYQRRHTRDRVDLNRNWFGDDEFPTTTDDSAYDEFRDLFEPAGAAKFGSLDFAQFTVRNLVPNLKSIAGGTLTKAAAQGQYRFPKGISYGGDGYSPHRGVVLDILGKYAQNYKMVSIWDLHTGLGRRQMQLLPNPAAEPMRRHQVNLFEGVAGRQIEGTGDTTFYASHGDFSDFVCAYIQKNFNTPTCANMLLEIGTVMPPSFAKAGLLDPLVEYKESAYLLYLTVRENQAYHYGPQTAIETARAIREAWTKTFRLSREDDPKWYEEAVLREARLLFPQFVERFARYGG